MNLQLTEKHVYMMKDKDLGNDVTMSRMLKQKHVLKIRDKDLSSDVPMRQAQREARLEGQRQRSQ